MKKLPITKEAFLKSRYFTRKYGKLEYVSESGKVFKTNKGKVLMFKESKDQLDDYLSKIDFNNPSSLGDEQGFSGRDLRTMGYKDLDDYWRQKDSERDAVQAKQIESGVMIYRTNRLGDLWTIKTIDGGLRLEENIKGFNRAMKIAQKNGWKVVKTIPKNPKAVKESDKKFGKKFAKESIKDIAPGIQDWGSTIYVEPLEVEMSWDDVYYTVKKDCRLYPLLEEELGLEPYEEPSDEQIREWIETNPKSFMDYLEEFGSYNATDFSGDDEYDESTKKFGRKFTEADGDIPVTEQEKLLCQYIQDEIEGELNEEMGLNLTCGCNWHNPGEEQHIEIYVGIPEDDDPSDPKYDNIETFLEQFVNKIGGEENEGQKWGDASFQWISDEEIFGELWPLGGEVKESTKKFGRKFMKESCDEEFDRYYERMKNIFRYDSGIHTRLRDNEDGSETIEVTFDDRYQWDDDVESGKIPLDEDSGLLDWITRFDERAHRNGWEFDYDIAKDIEHPIDDGANNDYLAMLTLTCKCDKEEDDLLFENSSESTDDMEKEFTYKGVTITRYDYESLPAPMAASKLDDKTMQNIAVDIYDYLSSAGWEDDEIAKYLGSNLDEVLDDDWKGEQIKDEFWRYMEQAALDNGMKYYEDLPEEENYTESKKTRFGKKFCKMEESMNWNGVTDKFIDNDKVQFTRKCPSCGKPHSITVNIRDVEDGCAKYGRGARIQDAFPNFSPDEREFFMSGICPDCWENM